MQPAVVAGIISLLASCGIYLLGSQFSLSPNHALYYTVISCLFLLSQAIFLSGFIPLSKTHGSMTLRITAGALVFWCGIEAIVVALAYLLPGVDSWQFVPFRVIGLVGIIFAGSLLATKTLGPLRIWAGGAMLIMYLSQFGFVSDSLLLIWLFTAAAVLAGTILLQQNPVRQ